MFAAFADFLPFISVWEKEAALPVLKAKVTVSSSVSQDTSLHHWPNHSGSRLETQTHSESSRGYAKGMGQEAEAQFVCLGVYRSTRTHVHAHGGNRTIYTELKGCVSPIHAVSLFGERVKGRGGRERKEVSTGPLLRAPGCAISQGQGPVHHSSSVSTCHLSAGLSSQRSPGKHRPCRGSHPHPSPAHRSLRWGWTHSPCCAGSPAGRKPGWDSAASDAWRGKGRRTWVNSL